jgi:short-subunit dehydrogenase involved in D-alanine esterification of teichoic acids
VRVRDRTILITGGGGGIGVAMARRFIERGNRVLACGRSEERLAAAARLVPGLETWPCDLTDMESVDNLAVHLEAVAPRLDMLINNAAVTHVLDFHDPDAPAMIGADVSGNIMGTVNASCRLLPLLERQPQACLAIVTSGIAYAPAPDVPGYSLTKAALHSLARSLRSKLADTSVRVVEIVPPAVDTGMVKDLNCKKMDPDAVARRVIRGLVMNRNEIRMGQTHVTNVVNRISERAAERIIQASFD